MGEDQQAYEFYKNPANQAPAGAGERRKGRRLSETVPVRFPKEMIEAVRRFAVQDGVTVSSWIRRVIGREIQRRQPSATSATSDAPSVQLDYSTANLKPASQTLADSDLVDFAATV